MRVLSVTPEATLPGGLVRAEVEGVEVPSLVKIEVGGKQANLVGASTRVLTFTVPAGAGEGIVVREGESVASAPLRVGQLLADDLHPVANPVIDDRGDIFVTYSGTRGEKVSFGVFRIRPDGRREPFLGDILNPTGLAIGPEGRLYVSSRHNGTIYRSTYDRQVEKFAEGLGVATGMVFDSQGALYVGDRSGVVYKLGTSGEAVSFCEVEASVSAYHLAIDKEDQLYLTAPTLATQDSIFRVSPEGKVEAVVGGLGRPQGLAFDPSGRLQVAASYRGRKGVFTVVNGGLQWSLSGPMLVGLAYDYHRNVLYLVDNANLYRVASGE